MDVGVEPSTGFLQSVRSRPTTSGGSSARGRRPVPQRERSLERSELQQGRSVKSVESEKRGGVGGRGALC